MKPGDLDIEWLERWKDRIAEGSVAARSVAFQKKLLQAQRLANAEIGKVSQRQVLQILAFAAGQVPHYRGSFAGHDISRMRLGGTNWTALPIVTRQALQSNPAGFRPPFLPHGHRMVGLLRSSGSTGTPIEVATSQIAAAWQKAFALRAAIWARREFDHSLAVVRKFEPGDADWPEGDEVKHWADIEGYPFNTGPRFALTAAGVSSEQHFDWLTRRQPDYLLTYPSVLRELVAIGLQRSDAWRPEGVSTLGEAVDDDLRAEVKSLWNIAINDIYSAEEVGVIAIQCPSHGNYHVQTESVFVEVVNERGRAVAAGQQGRVLVTTLANLATPLIRYQIGDEAVMGATCRCGRNGPVLERIVGRSRNMLVTNKGRYWPSFGTRRFREVAPISSMQFRQTASDALEFCFVAEADLTAAQHEELKRLILLALPVPMKILFVHVPRLERAASGKFELFVSDIGQQEVG